MNAACEWCEVNNGYVNMTCPYCGQQSHKVGGVMGGRTDAPADRYPVEAEGIRDALSYLHTGEVDDCPGCEAQAALDGLVARLVAVEDALGLAWKTIEANYTTSGRSIIGKIPLWNALADLEQQLRKLGYGQDDGENS